MKEGIEKLEEWEYYNFYPFYKTGMEMSELMKILLEDGWKLTQFDSGTEQATFRRPKAETSREVMEWENHHCTPDTSIGDSFMLHPHYNNSHPEDSYYFIISHTTGTAIVVSFCPWCGEKL